MRKEILIGALIVGSFMLSGVVIMGNTISDAIYNQPNFNGRVSGQLGVNIIRKDTDRGDILTIKEVSDILLYEGKEEFIIELKDGEFKGLPYIEIDGDYLISRKALEEWVYNKSVSNEVH